MANPPYLTALNDGFYLARRMGFTHTSEAFAKMMNDEPDPKPVILNSTLDTANDSSVENPIKMKWW